MQEPAARTQDSHQASERAQTRRIWLGVILPFGLALSVVAVFIGIALSLRAAAQVSIIANALLIALALCPLAVLLFPLLVISIALVALMSRWHGRTRSPLRRMERWTALAEKNVERWLGKIDGQVLEWAVRLAPMRQLLRAFDPPEDANAGEGEE